jgi:hypothetical protein
MVCFLDLQVMAPPEAKHTYADVDISSSEFIKAAPAYAWKRFGEGSLSGFRE